MRLPTVALATATGLLALTATLTSTTAAQAAPAAKPDVACMHAGIKTLQSAKLLDDVARNGLPISTALTLGVTPRPGADLSGVPDPLPLSLILADHRAGSSSLFIYPWCS
jgi:hypothetical protein